MIKLIEILALTLIAGTAALTIGYATVWAITTILATPILIVRNRLHRNH